MGLLTYEERKANILGQLHKEGHWTTQPVEQKALAQDLKLEQARGRDRVRRCELTKLQGQVAGYASPWPLRL